MTDPEPKILFHNNTTYDPKDYLIVKRKDMKRWAGKLYEAINDQEFVIDEFEDLMNEIEEKLKWEKKKYIV